MNTSPFNSIQDPPSSRLITGLAKIGLALKTQAWKDANTQGLSPTQAQILALLARDPTRAQRLSELAEALGVTPATTSDAVRSLSDKALVIKARSSENARALAITLTDAGRTEAAHSTDWSDFMLGAVQTRNMKLNAKSAANVVNDLSSVVFVTRSKVETPIEIS